MLNAFCLFPIPFCAPSDFLQPRIVSAWFEVVSKSKWMMIIKSPICLMVFVTHFVSKRMGQMIQCVCVSNIYHFYCLGTFFRIFFSFIFYWILFVHSIFGLPIVYGTLYILLMLVADATSMCIFIIRKKNKMKNVFNVRTVESTWTPNSYIFIRESKRVRLKANVWVEKNLLKRIKIDPYSLQLNTFFFFIRLNIIFLSSTHNIYLVEKPFALRWNVIVHSIGFHWTNKKYFFP